MTLRVRAASMTCASRALRLVEFPHLHGVCFARVCDAVGEEKSVLATKKIHHKWKRCFLKDLINASMKGNVSGVE